MSPLNTPIEKAIQRSHRKFKTDFNSATQETGCNSKQKSLKAIQETLIIVVDLKIKIKINK